MEEWLRSIGLAERIPAFAANRITEDQLVELTEADLRELGLTVGERKRFVRACELRRTGQIDSGPRAREDRRQSRVEQSIQAELRPLTIMFVDLENSTGIGEGLHPEDLMEVIRCYREFAGNAITRFGGMIARFVGDGILAYFCYPVANENDPERAIRAALAIAGGISDIRSPAPTPLKVRIGVATGRVLVSELFTGGTADMRTAIGSTPNLAARLQSLAPGNGIVISGATHERVRRHFTTRSLGVTELRGFDSPHEPWQVTGEASRPGASRRYGRPDQRTVEGGTALREAEFQGRDGELEILRALWTRAARGQTATVLVSGEAGIGKSRLVEHFCEGLESEGSPVLRFAATGFDEDSPLRPFIDYVVATTDVIPGDPAETAVASISRLLGDDARQDNAAAIIATLIGIAVDDPAISRLLPDQLRDRTIAVLVDHLLDVSADAPLCLVVEDLHWLDPTSCEVLRVLIQRLDGHRVMLVLTSREAATARWTGQVDAMLRLQRLSSDQVAAMMRSLFGSTPIPTSLLDHVVSKTDGVPLFVQEVGRLLLQYSEGNANATHDDRRLREMQHVVPASLDESLMAVLDRSGFAKEIAQVASVIGRLVRRDILAAASGLDEGRLNEGIGVLLSSGILERDPSASVASLRFHHALVQDAAYSSMVRDRRRNLHAGVAQALERLAPEQVAIQPEILAAHLTEAGLVEAAAVHWLEAARRNLARSALTEASRVLRRGLTALEKLEPRDTASGQAIASLRLQFSALLGPVLISLQGPNAVETQELYATAYELGRSLPEEPAHFPIHWGWWRLSMASDERTTDLMFRAKQRNDPGLLLQAHHCCWSSYMNRGLLDLCCEHIDLGLDIYQAGDYRQHARLYGNHDARACAHAVNAQVLWMQGRPAAALAAEAACMDWATSMDHLGTIVHSRNLLLLHRVYRREYEHVLQRADELITLTAAHGLIGAGAAPMIFRGWAIAALGDPQAGLRLLEEGWLKQQEISTDEDYPVYLCLMADVLTALGRPGEAVRRIGRELDGFEQSGLRIWVPELERVLGDAILAADASATGLARHHYSRAARMADAQSVPMLGLRIAMSEARLDHRMGAEESASRRMAMAYAQLPPESLEHDGPDMIESRDFVQSLGG